MTVTELRDRLKDYPENAGVFVLMDDKKSIVPIVSVTNESPTETDCKEMLVILT